MPPSTQAEGTPTEAAPAMSVRSASLLHASNEAPQTLKQIAELVAAAGGLSGKIKEWPIEEARKIYGPAVDGFVLDQKIESKKTRDTLGWQLKANSLANELPVYERAYAGSAKK